MNDLSDPHRTDPDPAPSPVASTPAHIGRYRVEMLLGEGASAASS